MSLTTAAKVIEDSPHSRAKSVCAKAPGRAPSCKSLVAVLVAEGWNSDVVGLGEL